MISALEISKEWLERTIIGLNLCPFARAPFEAGKVQLVLCREMEEIDQHDFFWEHVNQLINADANKISNSLLIYELGDKEFLSFFELASAWEEMLERSSSGKKIQMVVFHPGFYFADSDPEELGNLVNRSPFPTIHLLRTLEVAQATASLAVGENIAWGNKHKIEQLTPPQRDYYWWFLKS